MSERSSAKVTAIIHSLTDRLRGGARQGDTTANVESTTANTATSDTDERLVALFKNRSELKKAFTRLQEECDDLREKLDRSAHDPGHDHQRLAALEARLGDRETAYPALVYYQLRGLWRYGHNLLVEFSEQMQEQHHAREYAAHTEQWQARQRDALLQQDERIALVNAEVTRFQAVFSEQQAAIEALGGFWNHFRRRGLREQADAQELRVQEARGRLTQLQREREQKAEEETPAFPGLSTDARRNLNLAVLAFAQFLYLEFSPSSLSQLAHASMVRPLSEVAYGTRRDCESLMELIEQAIARMADKRGYAGELKLRAKHLRRRVTFESDAATIPDVASVATFPLEFHEGHAGVQVDINIIEDDYWHVGEVLLG